MRKGLVAALAVAIVVCAAAGPVLAAGAEDAKVLVSSALTMFKEKGKDYTLKVINARGPFAKGKVYVFALSVDNVCVAHPYNKDLVGKDLTAAKDVKGKPFIQEFHKVAVNNGSGWVDYWWKHFTEPEAKLKRSYIVKVPDEDIYIGAGYYVK
jgi:signal transduction histidine kinase